jgi:hypothetical protein
MLEKAGDLVPDRRPLLSGELIDSSQHFHKSVSFAISLLQGRMAPHTDFARAETWLRTGRRASPCQAKERIRRKIRMLRDGSVKRYKILVCCLWCNCNAFILTMRRRLVRILFLVLVKNRKVERKFGDNSSNPIFPGR